MEVMTRLNFIAGRNESRSDHMSTVISSPCHLTQRFRGALFPMPHDIFNDRRQALRQLLHPCQQEPNTSARLLVSRCPGKIGFRPSPS